MNKKAFDRGLIMAYAAYIENTEQVKQALYKEAEGMGAGTAALLGGVGGLGLGIGGKTLYDYFSNKKRKEEEEAAAAALAAQQQQQQQMYYPDYNAYNDYYGYGY